MADLADVMDALQQISVAAVYPVSGRPSVSGKTINVGQGWPPPGAVDSALPAGNSIVSIYAIPSSTSKLPAPLVFGPDVVVTAPVHGLSAAPTDTGFTLSGIPGAGEYVAVLVGRQAYTAAAALGDTAATIAVALATLIPGASAAAGAVILAVNGDLQVQIGAPGTLGRTIDRQRQNIMISVWAPNPSDRTVIGRALQVAVAQNLTVPMPDTSLAILQTQGVNLIDKYENELAYRRDLTVQAQWDTADVYPAYEITAVNVRLNGRDRAY